MRYGSVCSGIEAASMAWHLLGWSPAFFSEIDKFPSAVLAYHYGSNMPGEPDASNGVPNHGDMSKFEEWPDHAIDLLVGGTPCQSFSIAGLRKGLDDPRGNLMLTYLAIARRYRPRWLVWENVPGVLSSNGGRDFGTFIRGLEECGYHAAWRVLDAQYVRVDGYDRAVPQRRRRVFVVGYSGDWRRAAAVLFESESMLGHPAPRREAGQRPAPTVSARTRGGGGLGPDFECDGGLIAQDVAPTLNAHFGDKMGLENQHINGGCGHFVAHALRGEGFDASEDGTGRGTPIVPVAFPSKDFGADAMEDCSPTLRSGGHSNSHPNAGVPPAVAFDMRGREGGAQFEGPHETANIRAANGGSSRSYVAEPYSIMPMNSGKDFKARKTDVAQPVMAGGPVGGNQGGDYVVGTLAANTGPNGHDAGNFASNQGVDAGYVQPAQDGQTWAVRRLTPTECERLQGFPDGYTNIPWRGKETAPDGPRYKALGNSFAINVVRWIGQRIQMVEQIASELEDAA